MNGFSKYVSHIKILIILSAFFSTTIFAQSWPNSEIKIIVPFSVGGSVDGIPRMLQAGLQERLGVPVLIDNKAGASGTLGTAFVAKSKPNGNTWLSIADTLAVSPSLYPNLPFDTEKDLEPVLMIGTSPYVLAINNSRPQKTLNDILASAKQTPRSISYATFGSGSGGHLVMLKLSKKAGVDLIHVPYKGGVPAVTDAIAGHVDLVIGSAALIVPMIKSGKLRGVVQFGDSRLNSLTELPTVSESGFPGNEGVVWWGIFTTAGTPKPIIERFRSELVVGLKSEAVSKQISESMHIKLTLDSSDYLRKFLNEQIKNWGAVVQENGVKID